MIFYFENGFTNFQIVKTVIKSFGIFRQFVFCFFVRSVFSAMLLSLFYNQIIVLIVLTFLLSLCQYLDLNASVSASALTLRMRSMAAFGYGATPKTPKAGMLIWQCVF